MKWSFEEVKVVNVNVVFQIVEGGDFGQSCDQLLIFLDPGFEYFDGFLEQIIIARL